MALSSLRAGAGLPLETEAEVSRVRRLVALQQEEDRARRLEPGQERREAQEKVLGDRQELEWQAREDRVASTRGHRETALDGYIKVAGVDIYLGINHKFIAFNSVQIHHLLEKEFPSNNVLKFLIRITRTYVALFGPHVLFLHNFLRCHVFRTICPLNHHEFGKW